MGAVQKLATVVVVGLVGLATLLVVLFANEPNRREAEGHEQEEVAIERGIQTYLQFCLVCHGPKGEGFAAGDGRQGWPLNPAAPFDIPEDPDAPPTFKENQSEDPTLRAERARIIDTTIHNGRGLMPAWGRGNPAGPTLNDEQILELVLMIQNADWEHVYDEVLAANKGEVPTVPPLATEPPEAADAGGQLPSYTIVSKDIKFEPAEITVPADVMIRLDLPNQGAIQHNFSIDALGISVDQAAGATETVDVSIPAGSYEDDCNVPGHKAAGMVGTLIAETGLAVPTPAGGEQPAPAATPAAAPGAEEAAVPAAVTITSRDIFFEPAEVTIPANAPVVFTLPNAGAIPHNFSIDALGIDVDLAVGATDEVSITAAPGTYEYYCNVPGHKAAGMVGTLTAAEGAGPTAGGEPAATDQPPAGGEQATSATEPAAAPAATPAPSGGAIDARDLFFEPKEVTIPADTAVPITLTNAGAIPHNFTIDALRIDVDLPTGASQETTITAAGGDYQYYCNVPGHKEAGMTGTLHVQ